MYQEHLQIVGKMLDEIGLDSSRAGEFDAAVDILTDDGMPMERAMELMCGALRDPEPLEPRARHIVSLRQALA